MYPNDGSSDMEYQKIGLVDYFEIMVKRRRFILGVTAAAFVLAIVVSLLLPKSFRATALVLPPTDSGGTMTALFGQVEGLGNLANLLPGQGNGPELYVRMLEAEVIKDKIIDQFNLLEVEQVDNRDDLYKLLDSKTTFEAGRRDGLISIAVEDQDAERAAALANAYTKALGELSARLSSGSAGKDRIFLEQRLVEEKTDLKEAEDALKAFQSRNKALDVGEQGKATIEAVARLRAELAAQEVQLAMLRQGMTATNPEVLMVRGSIDQLQHQIAELEGSGTGEGSALPAVGAIPNLSQQYVRLLRDFKIRETIVELLTRQYEIARLTEAKNIAGLKVVQEARVPEKKFKPRRSLIVLLTTYVGLMLGLLGAFILERFDNLSIANRQRWRRAWTELIGRSKEDGD